MTKEEFAMEMINFFHSKYKVLMPKDFKERERIDTIIQAKVFDEFDVENPISEDAFIGCMIDELKKIKLISLN